MTGSSAGQPTKTADEQKHRYSSPHSSRDGHLRSAHGHLRQPVGRSSIEHKVILPMQKQSAETGE